MLAKLRRNLAIGMKRARAACRPCVGLLGWCASCLLPVVRFFLKLAWNGLAVLGLVCLLAAMYASLWVMRSYDLTPRQLALRSLERSGLRGRWVEALLTPPVRYADHEFQGNLLLEPHPRLIPGGGAALERIRLRYQEDADYARSVDALAASGGMLRQAAAWAAAGDREAGDQAIQALVSIRPVLPGASGQYGNGLNLALAYDLLRDHPTWTPDMRARIGLTLRRVLEETLLLLDSDSTSMWHGRFHLACSGWVVAASLEVECWEDDQLMFSRIQRHFIEAVRAIRLSGGWPEGYNYWINNRAFPFVMAATAHINAVDAPEFNRELADVLETVGLWTIHGTEPMGRFTLFGDTGPRADLKDETQRIIDVIGAVTGNDVFRDFSRYIGGRYGREGYYPPFRWGVPLFRGLPEHDFAASETLKDFSVLQGRLPTSAVFGRGGFGQAFSRSDWGPEATHLSFHAGHTFAHHGHYQNGHFTLSKGNAALALTSGTYSGVFTPHRLHYYIRTIAANSLLVVRPGEVVRPNRFFSDNVADGGQRVIIPTGSRITSVDHWRDNLDRGMHYRGGTITAFDNAHPGIMVTGADITPAYNSVEYDDNRRGGKVEQVTRQMVHLQEDDLILVHDRVTATSGDYRKKWLLHTWTKPHTATERVLRGSEHNGILESQDREATVAHNDAVLRVVRLLPENAVLRKVGGPEYRFYVEPDGVDLAGQNMAEGVNDQPWYDAGLWRLEIQPQLGNRFDRFLVVLQVGIEDQFEPVACDMIQSDKMVGAVLPRHVVLFGNDGVWEGATSYSLPDGRARKHVLVDLPPRRPVRMTAGNQVVRTRSSGEGVAVVELAAPGQRIDVVVE